jgi:hypothetical protein
LDRLPPGVLRKNKRKSEPIAQKGQSKRPRGSRGGIIGRPRKSEQIGGASGQDASEVAEETTVSDGHPKSVSVSPPRMSTRQIARKSVAATMPDASPEIPDAAGVPKQKQQTMTNGEDETIIGVEESKDERSEVPMDVLVMSPTTQTVDRKTTGRSRKKTNSDSVASTATSAKKSVKNKSSASKNQKSSPATLSAMMKQNKIINGAKPGTDGKYTLRDSIILLTIPSTQDKFSGFQRCFQNPQQRRWLYTCARKCRILCPYPFSYWHF